MKEKTHQQLSKILNSISFSDKATNEPRNEEKSNSKPNILSDAISNARKMNPKLGFKR